MNKTTTSARAEAAAPASHTANHSSDRRSVVRSVRRALIRHPRIATALYLTGWLLDVMDWIGIS